MKLPDLMPGAHWLASCFGLALAFLLACDTTAGLRVLVLGDSIFGTAMKEIAQEATFRGHVLVANVYGGTAITHTEGACPTVQAACDQTQNYWLPRIANLEAAGETFDCVVISLGTNDGAPGPELLDVLGLDAAFDQFGYWLLPHAPKGAPARAMLVDLLPDWRELDVDYEVQSDGIHPTEEGAKSIATALFDACEV